MHRTAPAALILAAALTLSACASSAPRTAAKVAPSPAATLSVLQACQLLRADVVRNGGSPDRPALRKIASETAPGPLQRDAAATIQDVGSSNQFMMPRDLAGLAYDCRGSGVEIPR